MARDCRRRARDRKVDRPPWRDVETNTKVSSTPRLLVPHPWATGLAMKRPAMDSELDRLVDAVPGLVWTGFPDGQIDFVNRRWCEYTGIRFDESCGRGWQIAVHAEDLPRLLADWRADPASRAPVETQARLRGADGTCRWFLFRAQPSADASGQIVKLCGLSTDIDAQVRAEEALRASERRSQALLAGEKRLLEMVAGDVRCGRF
jgi:PAS domain S-box-containing protein